MDEYISKHKAYTMMKDLEAAYIYPPVKEAYGTAARHIDQIPAADVQPVKQWVKLHDKHPDTEGSYLVCDQYGECEVAKYIPCIKSWFTRKVNGEIRYWMPLPEPPKDGDDDETL